MRTDAEKREKDVSLLRTDTEGPRNFVFHRRRSACILWMAVHWILCGDIRVLELGVAQHCGTILQCTGLSMFTPPVSENEFELNASAPEAKGGGPPELASITSRDSFIPVGWITNNSFATLLISPCMGPEPRVLGTMPVNISQKVQARRASCGIVDNQIFHCKITTKSSCRPS